MKTYHKTRQSLGVVIAFALSLLAVGEPAQSQALGSAFTYQGRLTDVGSPANGNYDLQFKLWDAATADGQAGSTLTLANTPVASGLFTVSLDFGAQFTGLRRWLEIGVRPGGSSVAFTLIGARQELTPTPNAVFAAKSGDATTVAGLTCTTGQVAKWSGSAWSCGADVDTNSGGTVTNVATGAGLTGGPITGSGRVSIASGGVTAGMIATLPGGEEREWR